MARAYGFRVFVVEAYPNRVKGNNPINASRGSGLADEIELLLDRLASKGTYRFEPRPDGDGVISKPVRTATLSDVTRINPDVIHARIAVGEEGSHAAATKPRKRPKSLAGWSAEAAHEVTFVFPRTIDSHFFLAAQTAHRRDPHLRLLAMLRDESKALRIEREQQDLEARRLARSEDRPVPKKQIFKRLAFDARQASDNDYLDELLSEADSATVTFKSREVDSSGNPGAVDRILQIKLRKQNVVDVGRRAGRAWVDRWRQGNRPSQEEAVSEVAGLLEERDLLNSDEHENYETAAISVHGKTTDSSTTISVDTLRDAFTYPVSDIRPIPYTYFQHLSDRLAKISRQESIDVEKLDAHRASECLTAPNP